MIQAQPTGVLRGLVAVVVLACGCADVDAPRPAASNPLVGLSRGETVALAGRIEERLVAGSYNYLALRERGGAQRWVVVLGAAPAVGEEVAVTSHGLRRDFVSPRLGRSFAELHFVTITRS